MVSAGRKPPSSPWKTFMPVSTSAASTNSSVMFPASSKVLTGLAALTETISDSAMTIAMTSARNFFKFLIGSVSSL